MTFFNGRPAKIIGTGRYIPERVMTNLDFEKFLDTNDAWILERTGIRERHFAAADEKCSDLAYNAAVEALADAKLSPKDVDMVLVGTNSPDTLFPSVASIVQGRLGAERAGALDVQAGCTGGLAAMTLAASGVASGLWDNVLVIGAERFEDFLDWTDRSTCILLGDGAGACVVSASAGGTGRFISSKLLSDGEKHDMITLDGDNGSMKTFKMKGNVVFKFVNTALPGFIRNFCLESEIEPDKVDFWIIHQANTRIIEGVFKRLGIPIDRTHINIEQYGNTSAASMMIVLDEVRRGGQIKSGDKIAFAAFGAGMTLGAMLYEA